MIQSTFGELIYSPTADQKLSNTIVALSASHENLQSLIQ